MLLASMSKRGAATASALPPKRAKKEDHHINVQTMEIVSALKLQREGLSEPSERKLLAKVAPYALPVAQDSRHSMQERVVCLIEEELQRLSASFRRAKEECTEAAAALGEAHGADAAKQEAMEATLKEQEACMQSKKDALALVADGHRAAKRQVLEAQEASGGGAKEAAMAEAALTTLGAIPSLEEAVPEVEQFLKKMPMAFEESLMISLPMSLSKKQEDRHDFDNMVVDQFKALVAKTKGELTKAMEEGRAEREARAEGLKEAQGHAQTKLQELLDSAAAFTEAKEAVTSTQLQLADVKQAVSKSQTELNKARHAKDNAEAELEAHESSTMVTFSALKLRQEPPAPAPALQEDAAAANPEGAPASEVSAPSAEAAA